MGLFRFLPRSQSLSPVMLCPSDCPTRLMDLSGGAISSLPWSLSFTSMHRVSNNRFIRTVSAMARQLSFELQCHGIMIPCTVQNDVEKSTVPCFLNIC